MGLQAEKKRESVGQDENQGDSFGHAQLGHPGGCFWMQRMKQGREYQGDDGKGEHASTHPGTGTIEPELAPTGPSNYKCESQNQEEVAQNAPGNRGLDQAHQT